MSEHVEIQTVRTILCVSGPGKTWHVWEATETIVLRDIAVKSGASGNMRRRLVPHQYKIDFGGGKRQAVARLHTSVLYALIRVNESRMESLGQSSLHDSCI